jgi:hypothetical protein
MGTSEGKNRNSLGRELIVSMISEQLPVYELSIGPICIVRITGHQEE